MAGESHGSLFEIGDGIKLRTSELHLFHKTDDS